MLAIKNYGHFWSRDLIDWGAKGKGNAGGLFSATKPGASDYTVDFREQVAIYVLFSENREVVYLGQTGSGNQRLFVRLRQHSRGQFRDRWSNFSWFGFLQPSKNGSLKPPKAPKKAGDADLNSEVSGSFADALDESEAILLQILEPRLNKQGPKWKGAVEYFQYDPFEPEPLSSDLMEKLEDIQKKIVGQLQ